MNTENKKKSSLGLFARLFGNRKAAENDAFNVEEIVSPGRQAINNFFERKLAVFALCVVLGMFVFVFVGPLFMPKYSDSYTEVTQKNVPPTMDMMKVPAELKNDIKMVDSYGTFTVGVSNSGDVYVWGATKIGTTAVDVADIPEEVQNANIVMASAGIDHIIAIDDTGKVYGWGNNRLGQYGAPLPGEEENPNIAYMPEAVMNGTIDVANIKKLTCGYQVSAIMMNDGTLYLWGNKNAYANIDRFVDNNSLKDIEFTLNYVVGLDASQKSIFTGTRGLYGLVRPNMSSEAVSITQYLGARKIVDIIANNYNICLVLEDGSVCFAGDFPLDSVEVPTLAADEQFVQIDAGADFYTGLTNKGNVYSWGGHVLGQSDTPSNMKDVSKVFAGSFQNYAVDENGNLVDTWGLKGYIFGTDGYGADIFQRIVNGGKMTMTIGAVAVIISSIIGIIIGCISGYFGGKVDMVLMRITEGFSAIPFLPFALVLSAVMAQWTLSETARIFIIMCILGVLSWTGLARLVRGQVLAVRESEYVTAAQSMGVKAYKIAFKHILPNVISVILVNLTLSFATCMLTESTLSYLGFGVNYPKPTWGNMLNGANNATVIKNFWWQWVFTSAFLAATTICINIVGDTLRDVMDPKSSVEK